MRVKASDIGTKLKRLREMRGLTQKELADRAGVSVSKIKWYEAHDYSIPTFDTVADVMKVLGYKLVFLKED